LTIEDILGIATLVLGPFIGSFIGLLSLRLPAGRDWTVSRSACGSCERSLGVVDLIPLLSYLALRGRCRTCGAAIPPRYPLFEVGCLIISAWAFATQTGWLIPATALLGWQLLLIAVIDAENFWLPDLLTLPLGVTGIAVTIALTDAPYWTPLLGAAVGYGALALIAWLYKRTRRREGLGGGDPRLLGAVGAWVGWQGLASVLVWACVAGLSVAAAMLITRRRLPEDQKLPFGTFLAIGAWLTWLLGPLHALFR
jgi:leader peptidase (prepilin peptidase)/N-methyltransferase